MKGPDPAEYIIIITRKFTSKYDLHVQAEISGRSIALIYRVVTRIYYRGLIEDKDRVGKGRREKR